jgi:hypothetical protein
MVVIFYFLYWDKLLLKKIILRGGKMKKTVSILLALALFLSLAPSAPVTAVAIKEEAAPYFQLNVDFPKEPNINDKSEFDIIIGVSSFSAPINGILSYAAFFGYPRDLEFVRGVSLNPLNGANPTFRDEPDNGRVYMGGQFLNDIEADSQLYRFTFKLKDTATAGDRTYEWIGQVTEGVYGFVSGQTFEPFKPGDITMPNLGFRIVSDGPEKALFDLNVDHPMRLVLGDSNEFDVYVSVSDFSAPVNGIMSYSAFLGYPGDLEFVRGESLNLANMANPAFQNDHPFKPGNNIYMGGVFNNDIERDSQLYKFTFKLSNTATVGNKTFEWSGTVTEGIYGFINGRTFEPFKSGDVKLPDLTFEIIEVPPDPYFQLNVDFPKEVYLGCTFDVYVGVSDFLNLENGIMSYDMFLGYPSDFEFISGELLESSNIADPALQNNSPLKPGNYVFMGGVFMADIMKDTPLYKLTFKVSEGAALGSVSFEWIPRTGAGPYGFINGKTGEPFRQYEVGMPSFTCKVEEIKPEYIWEATGEIGTVGRVTLNLSDDPDFLEKYAIVCDEDINAEIYFSPKRTENAIAADQNIYIFAVRLPNGETKKDINFSIKKIEGATEKNASIIYGDVNQDGVITNTDATIVVRKAGGNDAVIISNILAADVNGDANITNTDATLIVRRAGGNPTTVFSIENRF